MLLPLHLNGLNLDSETAVVVLTGTATAGLTESQLDTGGETFIWTLTNDTFAAAGTGPIGSTADTQAFIDGIVSDGAEAFGWNNIRSNIDVTDLTRDSDTQATLTLPALTTHEITSNETLTSTVPAAVLTGGSPLVASQTVLITADVEAPTLAVHALSFRSSPSQVVMFTSASGSAALQNIGAPGLFASILLENGSSLLLENNGKLKREIL